MRTSNKVKVRCVCPISKPTSLIWRHCCELKDCLFFKHSGGLPIPLRANDQFARHRLCRSLKRIVDQGVGEWASARVPFARLVDMIRLTQAARCTLHADARS